MPFAYRRLGLFSRQDAKNAKKNIFRSSLVPFAALREKCSFVSFVTFVVNRKDWNTRKSALQIFLHHCLYEILHTGGNRKQLAQDGRRVGG